MENHYVNNNSFHKELLLCLEKGEISNRALSYYERIVNNVSRKFSYRNPQDRDDCKQAARIRFLLNWHKYDPKKSNQVFAWSTSICKNAMAEQFNKLHSGDFILVPFSTLPNLDKYI